MEGVRKRFAIQKHKNGDDTMQLVGNMYLDAQNSTSFTYALL